MFDQHEEILAEEPQQTNLQSLPKRYQKNWQEYRIPWRDVITVLILAVILGTGYWLRSVGRNWDDYTHLHPDERFLTDVASTVRSGAAFNPANRPWASPQEQIAYCNQEYPAPDAEELQSMSPEDQQRALSRAGKGGYFDALCSDLNPNVVKPTIFVYGEFPLFSTRTLAEMYRNLTGNQTWVTYTSIQFVGRVMNSVFDTLSVLLVFLIGTRLIGRWQGLLAAGFYAFAAFPIQQSHFWTADAFTSFWVVLGIYFVVRVLDQANLRYERFVALPWVVVAVVIWLWELQAYDTDYITSLPLYLGLALGTGLIASSAAEQKNFSVAVLSGLTVGVIDALFIAFGLMSLPGGLIAIGAIYVLMAFWMNGWQHYAALEGSLVWLATAFGLWVFDSLAHYDIFDGPSLEPLMAYLLTFTGVGLGISVIRVVRARKHHYSIAAIVMPLLFLWLGIALALTTVSFWGIVSMLVLVVLVGGASYYGYQDEIGFGLAFGAAVAGRVNVLPLVGLLLLAMLLRALPLIDWRTFRFERNYQLTRLTIGLTLAGIATLLAFRVLQPHAFEGPTFLHVWKLNDGWTDDIAEAQYLVSGKSDIPPNWQWTSRVKWLFPLQNIVRYGLGIPLGIAAWAAFAWALVRIARGKPQWTRLAIPSAWVLVYFGWLGQNWVTTMRYFMPIYGMLCFFAGWGLIELIQVAYRVWRTRPLIPLRQIAVGATALIFIAVTGHTLAYGYGFTHILRTQLTRVALTRYMQEYIPGDIGLYIEQPNGDVRMVNMAIWPSAQNPQIIRMEDGDSQEFRLAPVGNVQLRAVALNLVGDPAQDSEIERVRVRIWMDDPDDGRQLLGGQLLEVDLATAESNLGTSYPLNFDPPLAMPIDGSRSYFLEIEVLEGGPVTFSRGVSDLFVAENFAHIRAYYQDPLDSALITFEEFNLTPQNVFDYQGNEKEKINGFRDIAYFDAGTITNYDFVAKADGVIRQMVIPHVSDPLNDADPETVKVTLLDTATGTQAVGSATGNFNTAHDGQLLFGPTVTIEFDEPFMVEQGSSYRLSLETVDLLGIGGSVVAWEGPWDDPMPTVVCPIPIDMTYSKELPSGLCTIDSQTMNLYNNYYVGLELRMHWPDELDKVKWTVDVLNETDYLVVGSNRFYDSFNRIPTRWPMSNRYYEALFNGELGFEVVEIFTSFATVGSYEWPDQVLPTDDVPDWYNEFEAEEAFHVYTHPSSFLLRKTENYSREKAEALLYGVNIRPVDSPAVETPDPLPVNRINWGSPEASESPTAFQFTEEQRKTQRDGGTWSELFDRDALINSNQVAGVAIWWALMVLVGWMMLPMMDWVFAALPDRGFAVGKFVGWLLVAWVAWYGSSLNLHLWSQDGLVGLLIALAAVNIVIAMLRYRSLFRFIRRQWRHLLIIEGLTALLFLFFIGIRLGNPDLWHGSFGGEKPMNFAYFNGVLKSTIFPAVDPWFANGYVNYYYWGYVLVGAPTKVLGVVPSIAYNLILPTLFAMTGMGAFSVSYNLVAWNRERREAQAAEEELGEVKNNREKFSPAANPYLAGVAALMLAVLLGNLDTIRVFANGVAQTGGWQGGVVLEQPYIDSGVNQFREEFGRDPSPDEFKEIQDEYGLSWFEISRQWFSAFWTGFKQIASGEKPLAIAANRWYWAPTRVIGELSNGRGHFAINEMPYFTYLYGDLHAHMMAMPLALFAILFVTAEILGAGRKLRNPLGATVALFLGGMTVGLLRPTNTWDWPIYMVLGVFGLTFAAWIGQGRLRGHLEPMAFFYRLRRFLDLRYVILLWPLLLAIPTGMLLRGALYVYERTDYDSRLERNEIPIHCQNITDSTEQIPFGCEEFLKPVLSASDVLVGGLGVFALVVLMYVAGLVLLGNRFNREGLLIWIARLGAFGVFSFVAILPYERYFATAYGKISPWELDKTPLWAYLDIHGIFLFILLSMLSWQTIRWLKRHTVAELRGLGVPVMVVLVMVPLTLLLSLYLGLGEYRIFLVTLPMFVWVAILFMLPDQSHTERWVYILVGLALALSMAVEMVVLEGDNKRQNIVFKVYIQVWLLFSISGGVSLAWLLRGVERWRPSLSGAWQMILAVLLSLGLLYPLTASQGRFQDRMNKAETPLTLDGMEFMKYAPHGEDPDGNGPTPGVWFNLNGDYYLIRWIQDNIEGTPTIIEGQGYEYTWNARVAIHTGLPTLIGWRHHQSQQRNLPNLDRMLWNRVDNARAFYTTTNIETAWNLIEFYNIEYITLGTFERILYVDIAEPLAGTENPTFQQGLAPGFRKFETMEQLGLIKKVYEREVCVHPTILTVEEGCPTDRVSKDIIYYVVPNAEFDNSLLRQR